MRLKVLEPAHVVIDEPAERVVAPGREGAFCLLPRHVDYATALAPGLLTFTAPTGALGYVAVDQGVLVKVGDEVLVSVRRAVRCPDLASVQDVVAREFRAVDDQERSLRSSVARLEADLVRRLYEMGRDARG